MADTIGRLIKRVTAGSASTSNPFADERALTSGAAQLWLTSDLNHLADESTYRTLASIPGFLEVDQDSPTLARGTDLDVDDFDWSSSLLGGGPANACLGTHWIATVATGPSAWPKAVLRGRVENSAAPGDLVGAILVVAPGRGTTPSSRCSYASASFTAGGSTWADIVLEIALSSTDVLPMTEFPLLGDGGASGVPAPGETITVSVATFWCAFFSQTGKLQAVGLTLGLEPPA